MTVDVREGEWLKITPPTGCFESELPPKWEDSKDGSEVEDASPEPNDQFKLSKINSFGHCRQMQNGNDLGFLSTSTQMTCYYSVDVDAI